MAAAIKEVISNITTKTQSSSADLRGGLRKSFPHCIANNLPKETVKSVIENIFKKSPAKDANSVYTASADWIQSLSTSIANELSANFNVPAENFSESSTKIANVVSSIGNGTWSSGITPINAIKDLETNIPLYISDYFDQLSGWSREHVFDEQKARIGSIISGISGLNSSSKPYPAASPHGPETALSGKYVKINWKLPAVNIDRPFNISPGTASFSSEAEPSSGEVYRYFAFIDSSKLAISMEKDGSIKKNLYNFTDPSQLWRIENYGNFYALYNKKYGAYLGKSLKANKERPDNNWHESAVYLVENDEHTYSIGYTRDNKQLDSADILRNLTLVTIPLVAWRNPSGKFVSIESNQGSLNFSDGETQGSTTVPKPEQLFLFVPHPDFSTKSVIIGHNEKFLEFNPSDSNKSSSFGFELKTPERLPFILFSYDQNIYPRGANFLASRLQQPSIVKAAVPPPGKGTRVRVWKSDPSVKSIGIRELFLVNTSIKSGPVDPWFETVSKAKPIAPDANGDFLLDFDNTPSQAPNESDNHTRFDVVHTFSAVRYTYDLLLGDLEYLDGNPPQLTRPWGNKRLQIFPHAGEDANAYYSREEGVLKFFFTKRKDGTPIFLCRSLDVVAHEAGHSFLDILQPEWRSDGQTGGFHEAFGDLCSLFVLISMADIADLFVTLTKANLRDPNNFLSAVGEEFGDVLFNNKGKGLRNLSNDLKGSKAQPEVHALSLVFSGFYYDVLVDIFALERNPVIKGDTDTLMDVATILRRALIIAIRVSSESSTETKYQELATNLETAFETLSRRLGVNLSSWTEIVRKHAKARELPIAGLR